MVTLTKNSTYTDVKNAFAAGGVINFDRDITIDCPAGSHVNIAIAANTTINGNGATLRLQMDTAAKAATLGSPYIAFQVNNSTTINSLHLNGRLAYEVFGSNITFQSCKVNQGSPFPDKYNALASGLYACFLIKSTSSCNVHFFDCEAWYADHMGYAVWNGGGKFKCTGIKWHRCKAMHCGSGWEYDTKYSPGHNPWGRGWDVLENYGVVEFEAIDCCAYDALQSGFYNEGDYSGRDSAPSGTFLRCHAENCGIRLANAAIADKNIIDGIPWPNGIRSGSPDVYGEGFYLQGGNMKLKDCTSKNNIIGFSLDRVNVDGFQDEGSWIGGQFTGGNITKATFAKPKYHAFACWNAISGNNDIRVIDPPSGRPPVLSKWMTIKGQRNLHPKTYDKIYKDAANMLHTRWFKDGYKTYKSQLSSYWTGYNVSISGGLSVRVNKTEYDTPSKCVGAHTGGVGPTSKITVTYDANLTYTPTTGCGGSFVPPEPTCDEINCGAKQIYDCATKQWVSILETDERYIARCVDKPPGGGGDEGEPTGHYPLVPKPVLQKGIKAKIYARDFGLGGAGKAYSDTVSGNQGSNTTYRNDAPDVDFVTWDDRMEDTDTNKTVIAYTSDGEWLKYPVTVIHCGKYKVTFRVSSGQQNGKIKISADGKYVASVDVPFTSANYATFTNVETTVAVPYIGPNRILKVEFVGDMNLFWFELEHTADEGCEDEPSGPTAPVDYTQHPYNMFSVRNEYGYECNIMAPQYDYGGEGKAYSNVANGREGTYRRGNDTIELFEQSIVTSSNEWVEYTINVSESGNYYFRLETSNMNDANARLEASIVDSYGTKIYGLFNVAVPVSPQEYKKFYAKADAAEKFFLPAGSAVTIRIKFTGEYLFKSLSIVSVDTYEGNIQSRPFKEIDLATLSVTIKPWEFDYGGQGISYLDRSEERSYQKPLRDSDVDVVTISKPDGGTQTIISGTMKGEWVQYTIKNTITSESSNIHLKIQCSTTDPISKIMIVFENEDETKTRDDDGNYVNSYKIQPPITNNFATLHEITLPVKVYKGRNAMKVYFDNNISMGELTFQP